MKTVTITRLAISPFSDPDLTGHADRRKPLRFLDSEWQQKRLNLFERFALSSIEAQVEKPDVWLIAIDYRVESSVAPRLRELLPDFAEIVVLAAEEDFIERTRKAIMSPEQDVLTIRLDSDDMLAPSFIQLAKKFSRPNYAINFPHGVQVYLPEFSVTHRWINSNPTVGFRSLGSSLHVHNFGNHPNVGKIVRMVSIPTVRPMYLKSSHENNHAPFQPNGFPVLRRKRILHRFWVTAPQEISQSQSRLDIFLSHLGYRLNRIAPGLTKSIERKREARKSLHLDSE